MVRASDVFACCSTQESYPAVILEAMAFELPIITTTVYGIAEQVIPNVSALTFAPGDVGTLARHMESLLDSPTERRRLGESALCNLGAIISHQEMVEDYEQLFLEAFVAGAKDLPRERVLYRRGVA